MTTSLNMQLLRIAKKLAQGLYFLMKLLPVQDKVVLISRFNRETSIDFQLIVEEIRLKHPQTKAVVLNHRRDSTLGQALDILSEMHHLATSHAAIVDSYIVPISILNHRPSLRIVQIWHALGAIKQFGYQTIDKPMGNSRQTAEIMEMHHNYSYIVCGGEATTEIYSRCFNVAPEFILPIGLPRVDYLLDVKNQARGKLLLHSLFPNLDDRLVILYAPTFRRENTLPVDQLIEQIDFTKYTLIIKLHTLDASPVQKHDSVYKANDEISVYDLLFASDYVITDYSATVFEAALLKKPLFFWSYDYEEYEQDCGCAVDYLREMPGLVSKSPVDIIMAIGCNEFDSTRIRDFAKMYINYQDGTCTRRLVDLLEIQTFGYRKKKKKAVAQVR